MKRILDCAPEDFAAAYGAALLEAVRRSEGRTLLCEILCTAKRCDELHLRCAGLSGIAEPLNLLAASLAIRGHGHTCRRMAMR